MIKVRELRIGNYVQSLSIVKVESLEERKINGYYNSGFSAIPLTIDILLKCGFIGHNKIFRLDNGFYTHVEFELSNSADRDWGVHIDNRDFQTVGVGDIQFLHQLQNMYFDVTGKELEVNI